MRANPIKMAVLLAGMFVLNMPAQTLQTLCSFGNTNGANPAGEMTLGNDGNFYGTTYLGGGSNQGTLFKITTNSTLLTLFSFNGTNGGYPVAGLTLGNDGNFYGTTQQGGRNGYGTVFQWTTNGTFNTLASFSGTNGEYPGAALTQGADGNFYGTTFYGGNGGEGTVFKVTTNGTLATLISFNNTNGEYPQAALALGNDGNFYGTTVGGGSGSYGTIFQITTNGALTTLISFNEANGESPNGLTLGKDGNFYGTTYGGSRGDYGTVFKVNTNGTLTTLVFFSQSNGEYPNGLVQGNDGNFYGTTDEGGGSGDGTVFQVTTNGVLTTPVFSFSGTNGENPHAALTLGNEGDFYGTTYGGASGYGTVFHLAVMPVVSQQPQNETQILGGTVLFFVVTTGTSCQWFFSNPSLQSTAGALSQTLYGFCYSATVTNGGSGYTTVPNVQFIGGGGSGASGTATVSNGQVTAITMTEAGSNYVAPPTVLIDPPSGLLIGQTNASLTLNDITTNELGDYFVVISNFYGSVTSSVVTLTQATPPSITQPPQNQIAVSGSNIEFSVKSGGTLPLSYQWWMVASQRSNATAVPVVINGFVLTNTVTGGGTGYLAIPTVQFVGGSGSGAAGTAVVSNNMVTAIVMSGAGSGYTIPPVVQIAAPTAIPLPNQTNDILSLVAVTDDNAGEYYVVVTNDFGSVTSSPAVLNIFGLFAPPRLLTMTDLNGGLNVQFIGTPQYPYILETATNLVPPINWQSVLTNPANANGNWSFTVTNNPIVPARFFRAAGQ